MTADRAVLGTCLAALLVVIGMAIGEYRAMQDLAAKCLPQPGEARLLSAIQTIKPEPAITCVFEVAPPAAVKVKRRAA